MELKKMKDEHKTKEHLLFELVEIEKQFEASETKHKQTKEALEKSERLYRGAIEAAGAVPYYRNYATNTYEFVGDGIEALTGYPAEEFTTEVWGSILQKIIPLGDFTGLSIDEAEEKVESEGGLICWANYRIRTRGGEERWLVNAVAHIRDEQGIVVGSIGLLQDITEQKRSEDALKESQAELSTIFNNAPIVCSWTGKGGCGKSIAQ